MTRARDLANIADGTFTATDLDLSGTLTVSGDANFDSGTLFVDVSANNVGIGTTTVNEKLVLGSADSGSNFLQITNSTTTAADNRGFYVGIDANENARIIQRENADMFFSTNNTEVMTLDASGNVGIGTSSPSTLLELSANNNSAASNNTLRFTDTDTATEANQQIGKIEFKSNDSSGDGALVRSYILSASEDTTPSSYISFGTNPGGAGNTTDERMRVTGTGNVGIGTAAPVGAGTALNVRGPSAGGTVGSVVAESYDGVGHITLYSGIGGTDLPSIVYPSIGLRFGAGSKTTSSYAEKMRLDASGNLLVGTTTTAFDNSNSVAISASQGYVLQNHVLGTGSGTKYTYFSYNAGQIGSITQNGTTGVSYNTSSDQRLKENITDANDAGDKIDAIQVRQFDWKADGSHQDYGMVAQELLEVAPEAVSGDPESDDMMGVDYSKLVPMMLKEIQSLRARVAQLEGA